VVDSELVRVGEVDAPCQATFKDAFGGIFICDTNNYRVRKVSANGSISTVAGTTDGWGGDGGPATAAKLNDPYGVAVDGFGNLFISDTDNYRIRKVDGAGIINTVVGSGVAGNGGDDVQDGALTAKVNLPYSLVTDPKGNLYIADSKNSSVRMVKW
jgi:hypothetical protein